MLSNGWPTERRPTRAAATASSTDGPILNSSLAWRDFHGERVSVHSAGWKAVQFRIGQASHVTYMNQSISRRSLPNVFFVKLCSKGFITHSHIKRTHTGEKVLNICNICSKTIGCSSHLHDHKKPHRRKSLLLVIFLVLIWDALGTQRGELSSKCDVCNKAFSSSLNLNQQTSFARDV